MTSKLLREPSVLRPRPPLSTPSTSVPPGMELVGIIPNPSIVQLDSPGETQSLAIQGYYSDGVASQLQKLPVQSVGFVSSDESIVSVTPEGLLTALDSGGVEITVSLCKYTAEVPVLVWDPVRRIPPLTPTSSWRYQMTAPLSS